MSRQVRVSQKQITDSKSFSAPLFFWVTVGSTLEWFHQTLNSCLTGLICLHCCKKKKKKEKWCVSTFISHKPILFDFKTRHFELVTLNFRLIAASKIVFLQTGVCFNCVVNLSDNHNFLWEHNSCLSEPAVWNGNLSLLECPAFVSDDVRSATHSWRLSSLDLINKLNTV